MSTYGSIRIRTNWTNLKQHSTAETQTHTYGTTSFLLYAKRTCWKCVYNVWRNMQNELTGKWHFASFSCRCLFFSHQSVGRLVDLRAMRFISKMTHFNVLEANIHTSIHIRYVHMDKSYRYVTQYTFSTIQIIHAHSTYLRIRLVGCFLKRNETILVSWSHLNTHLYMYWNKKCVVSVCYSFFRSFRLSLFPFLSLSHFGCVCVSKFTHNIFLSLFCTQDENPYWKIFFLQNY